MGEGKADLSAGKAPEQLEREVEIIRDNIDHIAGELDRRRHDLLDWRLQLRKHKGAVTTTVAGVVVLSAAAIVLTRLVNARRNRPQARLRRVGSAISRIIEHPELVAQPAPSISRKVLAAVATQLATMAVGRLASRVWTPPR